MPASDDGNGTRAAANSRWCARSSASSARREERRRLAGAAAAARPRRRRGRRPAPTTSWRCRRAHADRALCERAEHLGHEHRAAHLLRGDYGRRRPTSCAGRGRSHRPCRATRGATSGAAMLARRTGVRNAVATAVKVSTTSVRAIDTRGSPSVNLQSLERTSLEPDRARVDGFGRLSTVSSLWSRRHRPPAIQRVPETSHLGARTRTSGPGPASPAIGADHRRCTRLGTSRAWSSQVDRGYTADSTFHVRRARARGFALYLDVASREAFIITCTVAWWSSLRHRLARVDSSLDLHRVAPASGRRACCCASASSSAIASSAAPMPGHHAEEARRHRGSRLRAPGEVVDPRWQRFGSRAARRARW